MARLGRTKPASKQRSEFGNSFGETDDGVIQPVVTRTGWRASRQGRLFTKRRWWLAGRRRRERDNNGAIGVPSSLTRTSSQRDAKETAAFVLKPQQSFFLFFSFSVSSVTFPVPMPHTSSK